jgi:hypothetical protein
VESRPVLSKILVVVGVGNGLREVHFVGTMVRESTMDNMNG